MSNLRRWAQGLLADVEGTVILDTETTGLGSRDEVVQIGVLGMDGAVLLETLVRPVRARMNGKALRVHGIREEQLMRERPLNQIEPELVKVLQGKQVIVYNADFDRRMLRQSAMVAECNDLLQMLRPARWVCVMRTYARGGRWKKLSVACWEQRVEVKQAHDALGDCRLVLALLQKLAGVETMEVDGG